MPELLIGWGCVRVAYPPTAEPDPGRCRTGARENGLQSSGCQVRLLLVHQNFPGQFRQLAPHLESRDHELVAICSHQRPVALRGKVLRYAEPEKLSGVPLGTQLWHDGQQRSAAVARLAQNLAAEAGSLIESWGIPDGEKPWDFRQFGLMFPRYLARALDSSRAWWLWR